MPMNIETFLRRMFRVGAIAIRLPGGRLLNLGDGGEPTVAVTLTGAVDHRAHRGHGPSAGRSARSLYLDGLA